jgi:hypothetical protein
LKNAPVGGMFSSTDSVSDELVMTEGVKNFKRFLEVVYIDNFKSCTLAEKNP